MVAIFLQSSLCSFQSSFWHFFPQYLTFLQPAHDDSGRSVSPQALHALNVSTHLEAINVTQWQL